METWTADEQIMVVICGVQAPLTAQHCSAIAACFLTAQANSYVHASLTRNVSATNATTEPPKV